MEAPRGGAHGLGDVGELFVHEALERRGFISAGGNVGHALGFLAVQGQRARLVTSSCFMSRMSTTNLGVEAPSIQDHGRVGGNGDGCANLVLEARALEDSHVPPGATERNRC